MSNENGTILIKCNTESQMEKWIVLKKCIIKNIILISQKFNLWKIPNDQDMAIDEIQKCIT